MPSGKEHGPFGPILYFVIGTELSRLYNHIDHAASPCLHFSEQSSESRPVAMAGRLHIRMGLGASKYKSEAFACFRASICIVVWSILLCLIKNWALNIYCCSAFYNLQAYHTSINSTLFQHVNPHRSRTFTRYSACERWTSKPKPVASTV